jgi:putative transposase
MAHIPERWDGPNQWYFVTIATKQRRPMFTDASACEALKQAFHETHTYYRFRLAALVILPDHWHALIRPDDGAVIEDVVRAVKRNTLKKLGHKKTFWQSRFLDHRIRNGEDFEQHAQYIRKNPIKHEMTETPETYPWLFFHPRPLG